MDSREIMNNLLVKCFNDILHIEEKALITEDFKDITVNDMHIIEAIGIQERKTMSTIAKELGITMGTLTIGINGLVKKGYVLRIRGEKDRRVVYATLTDRGMLAYQHHKSFHASMVDYVTASMEDDDITSLSMVLSRLEAFLNSFAQEH